MPRVNLFVNRDGPVPLHDQLVAQVGQLVAAGLLAPGERLPSIRGLAARLGVHHLTVLAAYRTLADRGVLVIREGSGVRVADLQAAGAPEGGAALRAMAEWLVATARARGHDDQAILAACRDALAPPVVRRLVVVNPHPDLQALYAHELGERIDLPVAGFTPEEVEAAGAAAFEDACLLTSTNFAAPLRALLGDARAPVIMRLAPAGPMLERARALPDDAGVALISGSERFRFLMGELLAGVLPGDRLHVADPADAPRVRAALRHAALVVADAASAGAIAGRVAAPMYVHRLLAEDALEPLAERLAPEAFRSDPVGARARP